MRSLNTHQSTLTHQSSINIAKNPNTIIENEQQGQDSSYLEILQLDASVNNSERKGRNPSHLSIGPHQIQTAQINQSRVFSPLSSLSLLLYPSWRNSIKTNGGEFGLPKRECWFRSKVLEAAPLEMPGPGARKLVPCEVKSGKRRGG